MNPELDAKLCAAYPLMYKNRHSSMMETCMCWGFECGDGWYPLIAALSRCLQWDTDHNREPQIVVSQVKEKYGTLRFYVEGSSDRQDGMIAFAEHLSGLTCEICGLPGESNTEGWIHTRCDAHKIKPA